MLSSPLNSRRARLKLLHQRIHEHEVRSRMAQPIPVFHLRRCSHPECGALHAPKNASQDALIVYLGCKHQIPGVEPSATPETPAE